MTQKLKLMVVDDESDNLDLIYRTFRRQFQVFRADSPATALQILDAEGEMAVIISDQSMPEMSGTEFFRKISQQFPDTIRILLTGYSEEVIDGGEVSLKSHIFKCITKPWEPGEFKAILEEAAQIYQDTKQENPS